MLYLPVEQFVQIVLPALAENCPPGQFKQVEFPVVGWY